VAFVNDGSSGPLGERTGAPTGALTLAEWRAMGYDKHSVFADPLFTAPEDRDYRVRSGSPALELGSENFAMDTFGLLPDSPRKWEERRPR